MRRDLLEGDILPTPNPNQVSDDFVAFVITISQSGSEIDAFEDGVFAIRQTNPRSTASPPELLVADEAGKVYQLGRTSWRVANFQLVNF